MEIMMRLARKKNYPFFGGAAKYNKAQLFAIVTYVRRRFRISGRPRLPAWGKQEPANRATMATSP